MTCRLTRNGSSPAVSDGKWNRARDEIVIVATVTMSVKVRVVLVELHMGPAERMVTPLRRPLSNTLPGTVMGKNIYKRSAFRRGIFRVRMVVIEACAVREDQIALHLMKRERPMGIDLGELVFFFILLQAGDPKPPRILVWIFTAIVPAPLERGRQMGPHQFHRLHDRIDHILVFPGNPILCFDAEQSHHSLDVKREAVKRRDVVRI